MLQIDDPSKKGMTKIRQIGCMVVLALTISSCGNNKTGTETTDSTKAAQQSAAIPKKNILFFGNSLTAGYGLDNPADAFPGLIQKRIDSLKLPYKVINAGLSGETTAGGKNRIDWLLKQKVDVFVLELGANDGLRGIPVTETSKNLQDIMDRVKAKYPDSKQVLVGMQVPPNMGGAYASSFRNVFEDLAKKNEVPFVPFLLEGVGGIRDLNQADGIHPTAKGHKIVAENVWLVLKGIL
jgi:acyl-CoA thioesterase-1